MITCYVLPRFSHTHIHSHTLTHTHSHTYIHTYIHTRTLTRLHMISYNGQINNSSLANREFIASRRCIFTSRFQQASIYVMYLSLCINGIYLYTSIDMHICNASVSLQYRNISIGIYRHAYM